MRSLISAKGSPVPWSKSSSPGPDLDILAQGTVATRCLRATTTPEPASVFVIAVPTPFQDDHEPDLSHVKSAAEAIAPVLERGNLAILESTSPVGTTAKLTENSHRDVNIAFANELSLICDHLDINVWELLKMANQHPRVDILRPGPGVGGHCIAIDPWFIVSSAPEQARLIRMARQVNDDKPDHVISKVEAHASRFKAPVIACLDLAYKPDIDDLRESPALRIAEHLADSEVGEVLIVEPHIGELPPSLEGKPNTIFTEAADAIERADIVLLLVPHQAFKQLNRATLDQKILIDTQGMWA